PPAWSAAPPPPRGSRSRGTAAPPPGAPATALGTRTGCCGRTRDRSAPDPAPTSSAGRSASAAPPHGRCTPPAAPPARPPPPPTLRVTLLLEVLVIEDRPAPRSEPVVERPFLDQGLGLDLPRPQDGVRQVHLRVLPSQHPSRPPR